METYKRLNRWLRIIQFSYLAAFASFLNYLTLYLNEVGFSEFKIGIINAAGAVVMLLLQPILGRILDRTQNFRQVVGVVLAFCCAGVAATPFLGSLMWLQLLLVILLYAVVKQFLNVFDLWTYQLKAIDPRVEYGSTRGIGSVGEGLSTFIVGYLIAWFGFGAMFICTVLLLATALYAGLQLPNPPKAETSEKEEATKAKVTWTKPLLYYLASFLILKISVSAISSFSSLIVKNLGGGSEWFGITILLCGIAELPIFMMMGRWCQGDKTKAWYRICLLVSLVGGSLVVLAPNIPIFIVGRIAQTAAYAMYTVVNLEYVKNTVAAENQGQIILMIGAFSSSISYIVSSLLGGYILEMGTPGMMVAALGLLICASFGLHQGSLSAHRNAAEVEQKVQ